MGGGRRPRVNSDVRWAAYAVTVDIRVVEGDPEIAAPWTARRSCFGAY